MIYCVMYNMVYYTINLVGGLGHPSEKYEFVNWDDNRNPILMGKSSKMATSHHQPDFNAQEFERVCGHLSLFHSFSSLAEGFNVLQ